MLGDAASIGEELARAAAGYDPPIRVAVGPTMTVVMLLTLAHAALMVVDDVGCALSELPLVHLQQLVVDLHGSAFLRTSRAVTPESQSREFGPVVWRGRGREVLRMENDAARRDEQAFDIARRWGLTTLGELAALDPGELSARMGQAGVRIQQLARGADAGTRPKLEG